MYIFTEIEELEYLHENSFDISHCKIFGVHCKGQVETPCTSKNGIQPFEPKQYQVISVPTIYCVVPKNSRNGQGVKAVMSDVMFARGRHLDVFVFRWLMALRTVRPSRTSLRPLLSY